VRSSSCWHCHFSRGWLYARWSNWPWSGAPQSAAQQASPEVIAMVENLAARLARDGGSLDEWQMLGRSRVQLGQYDAAAEAYRQAYRMSGGTDVPTLTSYAEALVLADPGALLADAGDLFERALSLSPQDPKSLWYGGLAAFGREQYALARDRWQALLDHDPPPPEDVRQILADRIRSRGIARCRRWRRERACDSIRSRRRVSTRDRRDDHFACDERRRCTGRGRRRSAPDRCGGERGSSLVLTDRSRSAALRACA
jgi:hypothetical protein